VARWYPHPCIYPSNVFLYKTTVLGNFDEALTAAYVGMAEDTVLTRKRRSERRKKIMEKMKAKQQ